MAAENSIEIGGMASASTQARRALIQIAVSEARRAEAKKVLTRMSVREALRILCTNASATSKPLRLKG